MFENCGDNRFEIIEKAKKDILDATNINTSPEEMKVLDSFLFRCWQMGWLDKYGGAKMDVDEKTAITCLQLVEIYINKEGLLVLPTICENGEIELMFAGKPSDMRMCPLCGANWVGGADFACPVSQ